MEGWIVLNILCHSKDSYMKEKLGIEESIQDLIFNPYSVQVCQICGFGENKDINGGFVLMNGKSLETKETPYQIKDLICEDSYIRKTPLSKTPQVLQHSVMRGYFGLPFDFKITAENGDVMFINDEKSSLLLLSKLDLANFKMQQFTGILDRNKAKIYFGDKMIFADKVEWYHSEYWSKVMLGHMTKKQALEEIESRPYEERIVENNEDFEWLLSSDICLYWEVVL